MKNAYQVMQLEVESPLQVVLYVFIYNLLPNIVTTKGDLQLNFAKSIDTTRFEKSKTIIEFLFHFIQIT